MAGHSAFPDPDHHQGILEQTAPARRGQVVHEEIAEPATEKDTENCQGRYEVRSLGSFEHPKLIAGHVTKQIVAQHEARQISQPVPSQLDRLGNLPENRVEIMDIG